MNSPPGRKQIFVSLQAGRAIAAILVILFHCADIFSQPKYWNNPSWKKFLNFGYSGVDIFFVLSGIVILHAHWNDIGRVSQLRSYLWKRFRRIYPIYWVILAVLVPVYLLKPSFGGGLESSPSVILESFLLVHLRHTQTVLAVAWTLYHEVMFYVVFASILINRRLGVVLITLWMVASGATLFLTSSNLFVTEYLSPLHLLFGMGMVMLLLVRRNSLPGLPLLLTGLAVFSACAVFDDLYRIDGPGIQVGYGVASALALGGLMLLEQRGHISIPKFLKFLGDASYSIYLVHDPLISLFTKLLYPLSRHHRMPLFVPFVLLVTVGISAGAAMHQWIEKPLLRALSRKGQLPKEVTV